MARKPKAYFQKKNRDNYELNKRLSSEYQATKNHINETFTEFKRRRKKHLGY